MLLQAPTEAAMRHKLYANKWGPPTIQRAAWRIQRAPAAWQIPVAHGDFQRPPQKPATGDAAEQPFSGTSFQLAAEPPAICSISSANHLDELQIGARLACLAYTDDKPGTTLAYNTRVLRGTLHAIEAIAGGPEEARKPLSALLREQLGYTSDCVFSHTRGEVDTQGFIAHSSNGDIVLAFRGTTNGLDWATNVDTRKTDCDFFEPKQSTSWFTGFPMCCLGEAAPPRVHHGFMTALSVALPDIETHLLPQLRESASPRRVIIAGHSLGGALATGAFAYLLGKFNFAESPHEVHLVTLGAPRFGDARFVGKMMAHVKQLKELGKCSVKRVVHHDDAVPTVPPELFGFDHVGGLCRLAEDVSGRSRELEGEDVAVAPRLSTELVTDHEPVRYLRSIDDFVQRSGSVSN